MTSNDNDVRLLHVYGQEKWHDDVYIVGNRTALKSLADSINKLLDSNKTSIGSEPYFANDGEGYGVEIKIREEKAFNGLTLPYSDEIAKNDK